MRSLLTRLHRYTGLALAIFLALAGLNGSLIVFYHELDRALNPELYHVPMTGAALSPDTLAARIEQQLPGAKVTLLSLSVPPGRAAEVWVEGVSYDQVFADPASGRVLGKRKWGAFDLSRAGVMPLIYVFHYTLKLPGTWGVLLMGIVACLWTIDCFVAFTLTLPRGTPFWRKWKKSWVLKQRAAPYRVNLDLHRAGGLWLWVVLFTLASSGVALNLPQQVFRPVVKLFATLSPSADEIGAARLRAKPAVPRLTFGDALARARQAAPPNDFVPRYVFHQPAYRAYGVGFGSNGVDGMDGLGLSYFYFDDRSGTIVTRQIAGDGKPGDVYAAAQFQLHSGRILGWPGRILVCLTGLAVTLLSITGIYLWAKKRGARRRVRRKAEPHRSVSAAIF